MQLINSKPTVGLVYIFYAYNPQWQPTTRGSHLQQAAIPHVRRNEFNANNLTVKTSRVFLVSSGEEEELLGKKIKTRTTSR